MLKINNVQVKNQVEEVIKSVSVKLGLVYRDWQQAIGDIMLEKNNKEKNLSPYSVIGYKKIEEMWDKDGSEEKKWLERAERIFKNLNLSVEENSDSRIIQLDNMYLHSYYLLKSLYKTRVGFKPISQIEFDKIPKKLRSSYIF